MYKSGIFFKDKAPNFHSGSKLTCLEFCEANGHPELGYFLICFCFPRCNFLISVVSQCHAPCNYVATCKIKLWIRRKQFSGMWRRVDIVLTDVSEERIAFIFRL
jgi:hypothetical protein